MLLSFLDLGSQIASEKSILRRRSVNIILEVKECNIVNNSKQQLEYKNESLTKALINLQNNLETFAQLKNLSRFIDDNEGSEKRITENGSI